MKRVKFPFHLTREIEHIKVAFLPFKVRGTYLVTFRSKINVIPTTALPAEKERLH